MVVRLGVPGLLLPRAKARSCRIPAQRVVEYRVACIVSASNRLIFRNAGKVSESTIFSNFLPRCPNLQLFLDAENKVCAYFLKSGS